MNKSLQQLEQRLFELEVLRRQRQSWLNDLIAPMAEHLQDLAAMQSKNNQFKDNVIRFPLERRFNK